MVTLLESQTQVLHTVEASIGHELVYAVEPITTPAGTQPVTPCSKNFFDFNRVSIKSANFGGKEFLHNLTPAMLVLLVYECQFHYLTEVLP